MRPLGKRAQVSCVDEGTQGCAEARRITAIGYSRRLSIPHFDHGRTFNEELECLAQLLSTPQDAGSGEPAPCRPVGERTPSLVVQNPLNIHT